MKKKIKKLLLIFNIFVISITICGCNNDKLIINSYESPKSIFEIEMKGEYLLEENYEIIVKYGHSLSYLDEDSKDEHTITLFQIHYYEDEHKLELTNKEFFSGHILFEVENFFNKEYYAFYEIINKKKTYTFPKEITINIPKELLIENYGLISLSLINYRHGGTDTPFSVIGSLIYLKYNIKGDKIFFKEYKETNY